MKRRIVTRTLAAGLLLAGCSARPSHSMGVPSAGTPITVSAARALKPGTPVVLHGTMVEKCPVSGCWFVMRDQSGIMRIDTKAAGFVVVDVPLKTDVTVNGRIGRDGDQPQVLAQGLRY